MRGEEIMKDIEAGNGANYPFEKTTALNIGNPQTVGQGTIEFNREVLAGMTLPDLCNQKCALSKDAI